jgi:hypothetical protein
MIAPALALDTGDTTYTLVADVATATRHTTTRHRVDCRLEV